MEQPDDDVKYSIKPQVVQMRDRGQITIPAEVRKATGAKDGDVFTLIPVGDGFFLVRKKLVVPELLDKMQKMLEEAGVTLDDLLEELETQRKRYNREHGWNP